MLDLTQLTRAEQLLIVATFDVDTLENTGSGHNTEWSETVDLVLQGRKGLFSYPDDELMDEVLELYEESMKEWDCADTAALLDRCRRLSRIQVVDEANKTWEAVDPDIQAVWDREEQENA